MFDDGNPPCFSTEVGPSQSALHVKPDAEMGEIGKYIYIILGIENWDINSTTIIFMPKISTGKSIIKDCNETCLNDCA